MIGLGRSTLVAVGMMLAMLTLTPRASANAGAEAAVRGYFEDMASRGLVTIADHMHPAEMVRFRDLFSPVFEMVTEDDDVFPELFGNRPKDEVVAMDAASFMRTLFGSLQAKIGSGLTFAQPEILGTVMEDETAHVLARVHVGMAEVGISQMQVISLRQDQGVWKMLLTGDITGMGEAIRNQIARQREAR